MARTTVNIEDPLLEELKAIGKEENASLSDVVSEALALGLAARKKAKKAPPAFKWVSQPLEPMVNLKDKDALANALDKDTLPR
ncbi:MAG: hypothetical protein SF187_16780 [Deltaproteobacteria bacterium]|nr:hypothetical protein [Deltaproteobacteria bacterium]